MARGVVEQALINCEQDQFLMIMIAAQRAKMLENGAKPFVSRDGSCDAVLALRELAAGYTPEDFLRKDVEDELED